MSREFQWLDQTEDAGFEEGWASTFGYDDPLDNGVGAWGDDTNRENAWGVALPIQQLREIFGDDDLAHNATVELLNPHTGKRLRVPIKDKGPAEWVLNRQGPTIDVTEGIRREMGLTGKDPMMWRVLGHGVEQDDPPPAQEGEPEGFRWLDEGAVPEGGTEVTEGEPEGFRWVDEVPEDEQIPFDIQQPQANVPEGEVAAPGEKKPFRYATEEEEAASLAKADAEASAAQEFKWADKPVAASQLAATEEPILVEGEPGIVKAELLGYAVRKPKYVGVVGKPEFPGLVEQGTIDIEDPKKSASTDMPLPFNDNGQEVLIPQTVNGTLVSPEFAIGHYKVTGEHLGKFKDVESANAYIEQLRRYQGAGRPKEFVEKHKGEETQNVGMLEPSNMPEANPVDLEPIFITQTNKGEEGYGKTFVIPSVIDGKKFSSSAAIRDWKKTGKHLGVFDSEVAAASYLDKRGEEVMTQLRFSDKIPSQSLAPSGIIPGEEPPTGKPVPAPAPKDKWEKRQANRQRLINAIEATEASGYPVEHKIGQPDEPEGDRGWTEDAENLVAALKQIETASKIRGDVQAQAEAAGERAYWEQIIKTQGMTKKQAELGEKMEAEKAGKLPKPKVEPEEGLAQTMARQAMGAFPGEPGGPETLPTMSAMDADRLGLQRWRDLDSGFEVRRAGKPEERAAIPVHGGTPAPTPLVRKGEVTPEGEVIPRPFAPPAKAYDYTTGQRAPVPEPYRYGTGTLPKDMAEIPLDYTKADETFKMIGQGASDKGLLSLMEGAYASFERGITHGVDFPGKEKVLANIRDQRDQVAAMRKRVREEHLPVDKEFAEGTMGQILSGAGQILGTGPFYVSPGLGAVASGFQLIDELRQDYIETMRKAGKPVNEDEAMKAAYKYLSVAGIADVATDIFALGKLKKLLSNRTKLSIKEQAGEFFTLVGSGSVSEGFQEWWGNLVAKTGLGGEGYEPTRPLGKGVGEAAIVGGGVGGLGGAAIATGRAAKGEIGFGISVEQDKKLAALKNMLEARKTARAGGPAEGPTVEAARVERVREMVRNPTSIPARPAPAAAPAPGVPAEEVPGPDSDAELARLITEHIYGKPRASETGGVSRESGTRTGSRTAPASAVAQARAKWDNLSEIARYEDILPELIAYQDQAKALGIEFVLNPIKNGKPSEDQSPAIVTYGDGRIELAVGGQSLFRRVNSSNLPRDNVAEARIAIGEETVHAGDIIGLKKMWDKSPEKNQLDQNFNEYMDNHAVKVFDDIQATIDKAPPEEQAKLYQAISDSFSGYYIPPWEETGVAKVPTDRAIMDYIRTYVGRNGIKGPQMVGNFIREFTRMAKQQESQGLLSEFTYRRLLDTVKQWFTSTLNRLTDSLPGVREGKFGKEAQNELKRIDDTLKELGVSIPKMSPTEQIMAKSGGPAPRVGLVGKMKERFLPKPKPKPTTPPSLKAAMAALTPTDRLRAAIQVKGETFTADTHYEAMRQAIKKFGRMNVGDAVAGDVDYQGKFMPWERAEQRQGMREGPATVNIGLATDDGKGVTEAEVLQALRDVGVNVTNHRVQQSGTEPTVVAYLDKTLEPEEAFKLAVDLNQEAIAEQWVGGAELYGPGAEAWRPFNREYFIEQRGGPDPELARGLDELEQIARDYEKWKRWYKEFSAFLDRVLLPENRIYKPLITDFMAALSVQTGIEPNVKQSIAALREFIETGSISPKTVGFPAKAKLPNLMKAIKGERLGGPKVGPFSRALRLDPNAAAIDRHVAMILFNTRAPTDAQIRVGQQVAAQIAQRLGWEIAEVQAAWWAAGKELFGERGKAVETYEQFYEEYKDDLNSILTQDREGEGKGLRAVGRLPEGVGEGERFPGSVGPPRRAEPAVQEQRQGELPGEVDTEAREPEIVAIKDRGIIKGVIPRPVGRVVSLEGKNRSFIRNPLDWASMSRIYSSTARMFANAPIESFKALGHAIRMHIDKRAAYRGEFHTQALNAYRSIPMTKKREALDGYQKYWENNQRHGRNFADNQPISKYAKQLVDVSKGLFDEMGARSEGKIKVYNPETKHWYPFRRRVDPDKDYHPYHVRDDIMDMLKNPAENPEAWEELKAEMIAEGIITEENAEAQMLRHRENFLAHYKVNGFFGSIERARVVNFPTKAYDFSYRQLLNYINSWSERMAQTEAFGQGTPEAGQRTLWDVAIEHAGNKATAAYIKGVRDRAYNVGVEEPLTKAATVVNNVAVLSQLANWYSTSKNFLSGHAFNWAHFGTPTFLRTLLPVREVFGTIDNGYEKGILQNDMMSVMQDGEGTGKLAETTSNLAGFGLWASGFTAAEVWVRGGAMKGSKIAFRQNLKNYQAYLNERGKWTSYLRGRKAKQWLGYLNRLGFSPEESADLMLEGGKGPMFDRYMRAVVNQIQGGYSYGHVPLIADQNVGRTFLKYHKWGIERLQDFSTNVSKPFLRSFRVPGSYEEVTFINEKGEKETARSRGQSFR